jgi:hypothetical protein
LPDEPVENDGRIDTFDVVSFIDKPTPPRLLHVVTQFDSKRTVIPRTAESSVNFGRREDKSTTFCE